MSVRNFALFLLILLSLGCTLVWGADRETTAAPAIEMSEPPPASAGHGTPDAVGKPTPAKGDGTAPGEADPEDVAPPSASPLHAGSGEPAFLSVPAVSGTAPQPKAPGAAVPVAPSEAPAPVPWWREVAGFLGLASDPHPGEIAEPAPGRPQSAPDYIIGAGDQLGISVWRDENLTRTVVVLPDGKIAFPLVGDLVAGGKTVVQLKKELEGKLARYMTDSGLTVEVKQSNSMIIYIIGRVNTPGRQMMVATTNVLQGLAMAGGLNPYARRSDVKVFRKQEGKTSVFSFNYDDVAEGRHLETNIDLQKGDVILVP